MPIKQRVRSVDAGMAEAAKRYTERTLKEKILFANEWLNAGKSQEQISAELKLKGQGVVSHIKTIIDYLGIEFVELIDLTVRLKPLFNFAKCCQKEIENSKLPASTPSLDHRNKIVVSRKAVAKSLLQKIMPEPTPNKERWWIGLHLHKLGDNPRFAVAHPSFAAMLKDITNYTTLEAWLAAHPNPSTKTGVATAKK